MYKITRTICCTDGLVAYAVHARRGQHGMEFKLQEVISVG
jgi:hypothetical protein